MSEANALDARMRARLAALAGDGLLRTLRPPSGVDLSSNDYLNLSQHPFLTARFSEAAARDGCGSTGSRLLRGHRDQFAAVEDRFARFKRAERALYFSSGYLANLAILTALPERGDTIFSDERNHASLIDGARLSRARTVVFPHNDMGRLEALLTDDGRDSAPGTLRFVVVESLFSMDGDRAPLESCAALCRAHGAVLVVDEAHAVGIFGERGTGLLEESGITGDCISINTAGKALGVAGAFVAGSARVIEYLVQRARPFVFSTAPPPALAAALDASLTIVEQEPERRSRLLARARFLRQRLREAGVPLPEGSSQIIPVVLGDQRRATATAAHLQDAGFDVRAIRPPSVPPGTSRLRISLNAALDEHTLDSFARTLATAVASGGEVRLCSAASS